MSKRLYHTISLTLICLLLLETGIVYAAPAAQEGEAALQACEDVKEADLQDELNRITQDVFASALAEVDLPAIVTAQWAE